jgi:predicted RNase H-like HicB family nuclease
MEKKGVPAMRVKGYIIVSLVFKREGRCWTGRCPELGTATYGSTVDEVSEALREAIMLQLNTLEDVGECERFLKENNIKFYRQKPDRVPDSHRKPVSITDDTLTDERLVPVCC